MLCSLFVFGFLFLPPSPLPSFPYPSSSFSFPLWVILLSSLDPLSRLLSGFSVPFRLRLSFRCFLLCPLPLFLSSSFVSVSFPLPSSSLHAASSSFWSVLAPLCCVPLRCVSLSPLSPGSLLFPFSLSSFASFSASSSSRPFSWPSPPLLPSFVYLASSFSASLTSSSFSASLPLPSSPLLPSSVFLPVLLLFLSPSVSFSDISSLLVRRPFVLLLAFLLFLLLLVFDPPTLPVSPPLRSSSFPSDSATRWFSLALPLVCLSCSAGWSASILSSSSSSPFSSSPVVFDSSVASSLPSRVSLLGVGDGLRWVLLW